MIEWRTLDGITIRKCKCLLTWYHKYLVSNPIHLHSSLTRQQPSYKILFFSHKKIIIQWKIILVIKIITTQMVTTIEESIPMHPLTAVEEIPKVVVVWVEVDVIAVSHNFNIVLHFCHNSNNISFHHGLHRGNLGPHYSVCTQ